MRIMITGAHGLLGQKTALIAAQESAHSLLLTDLAATTFFRNQRFEYQQLDITQRNDVKSLVAQWKPDVIVNTAAMTDVDGCESDREACWRLNVDGLKNLIIPAKKLLDCHVIQLSTDYVFDGKAASYDETSRPNPLSYYGKSKLASENALTSSGVKGSIVRTQVLYGTGYKVRQNFVAWVLAMFEKAKPFRVVDDQIGNPTFADDLAYALLRIAETGTVGLYHVSGPEAVDRFTFATSIANIFGFEPALLSRTTSADIGQAANRPMNSTFVTLRFEAEFRYRLSDTQRGLKRLLQQFRDGERHMESLLTAEI